MFYLTFWRSSTKVTEREYGRACFSIVNWMCVLQLVRDGPRACFNLFLEESDDVFDTMPELVLLSTSMNNPGWVLTVSGV